LAPRRRPAALAANRGDDLQRDAGFASRLSKAFERNFWQASPLAGQSALKEHSRVSFLKRLSKRLAKRAAIQTGLELLALPGAARLLPSAAGRGLIFTLHHVRPAGAEAFQPNALLEVTPEFLGETIELCLQLGLTPVPLAALPDLLADPADTRRFVCFTLDDGYRDNAEFAQPVFRRFAVPFTVFVAGGFIERTRTIWWETIEAVLRDASSISFDFGGGIEQVRTASLLEKFDTFERLTNFVATCDEDEAVTRIDRLAAEHGVDPAAIADRLVMTEAELRTLVQDPLATLGAHTLDHLNLKRLPPERLAAEIAGSAAKVVDLTGRPPVACCYPYGGKAAAGAREYAAAAAHGFRVGVTTQPGVLSEASLRAPTALPRVSLNGLYQKRRYVAALASGLPFKLMR
jgi:peptidoglycan/xylan/chitin deacetylase (PgdA/CDA1 family)